jgi:hypothetical protein
MRKSSNSSYRIRSFLSVDGRKINPSGFIGYCVATFVVAFAIADQMVTVLNLFSEEAAWNTRFLQAHGR